MDELGTLASGTTVGKLDTVELRILKQQKQQEALQASPLSHYFQELRQDLKHPSTTKIRSTTLNMPVPVMPSSGPTEKLPGPVPHFIIFHLPHFFGTLIAFGIEHIQLESILLDALPSGHKFAFFGIGLVVLANINSYLTGCVACARLEYNVKLPNLYADKAENKHAVLFNCIQRSHQNFMEAFPQVVRYELMPCNHH